jgi:hypothetical protein
MSAVSERLLRPFRALVATPRRRHWTRVGLCLILVVGPGLYGWLYRPSPQEAPELVGPKIAILSDQRDVAATVNMTLSVDPGQAGQSSKLQIAIVPTSISRSAMLTVELDDFPSRTKLILGPSQLSVIHPPATNPAFGTLLQASPTAVGYSDYVVTGHSIGPNSPALITILTQETQDKPFGEAVKGAQLRVTFPALEGETPGANPSTPLQFQDLYSGAQASSGSGYPLALQAGMNTFTFQGTNLSDYQFLAGDSPVPLNTEWSWDGINDVTALAANVATQDADQRHLFYSGVAFGIAAGAVISFLLELIPADPVRRYRADPNVGIPPG